MWWHTRAVWTFSEPDYIIKFCSVDLWIAAWINDLCIYALNLFGHIYTSGNKIMSCTWWYNDKCLWAAEVLSEITDKQHFDGRFLKILGHSSFLGQSKFQIGGWLLRHRPIREQKDVSVVLLQDDTWRQILIQPQILGHACQHTHTHTHTHTHVI